MRICKLRLGFYCWKGKTVDETIMSRNGIGLFFNTSMALVGTAAANSSFELVDSDGSGEPWDIL